MNKRGKAIGLFILAFCLLIAMSAECFAAVDLGTEMKQYKSDKGFKSIEQTKDGNGAVKKEVKPFKPGKIINSISDSDNCIIVHSPVPDTTYYKGEPIAVKYEAWDTWTYYFTRPMSFLRYNATGVYYATNDSDSAVDIDSWNTYTNTLYTSSLPVGSYTFSVMNFAYEYPDDVDFVDLGNEPWIGFSIYVKELKAPTCLKVSAKRKKAVISFKKATGATRYEIYRSTKKSSGYKKIKTTTSNKYTDKKVKKGKRYYYKVRSVRTVRGTVKSKYSAVKRSAKIKR